MLEDQAEREQAVELEEDWISLQGLRRNPLLLNTAAAEDLAVFPFLTALHIEQFISYRKLLGPLADVYELQAVPGWDTAVIRRLLPYVRISAPGTVRDKVRESLQKAEHQLLWRTTMGSTGPMLLRYQLRSPMVDAHVTLEKDRGESWWQQGKGLAFASAYVSIKQTGVLKQWVVGDYLVNLGQGLLLWQGRGIYKSTAPVMVKRQQAPIQPYRSLDENRFMRGTSVWLSKRSWQAVVFLSLKGQDANLKADSAGQKPVITSFLFSGLHRTASELADKDAVQHRAAGLVLRYQKERLAFSVQGVTHRFSHQIMRAALPYNAFALAGDRSQGISLSGNYGWRGVHAFGEWAYDGRRGAALAGLMAAADRSLDLSLLIRRIHPAYQAFGARAFTENEAVNNESGMYLGLSWRPLAGVSIDGYLDRFRFPWLKYRVDQPSEGTDQLIQFSWRPDRQTRLMLRWRYLKKAENESGAVILRKILSTGRSALRFHLERTVSPRWEWRARMEIIGLRSEGRIRERGFMGYLECHWMGGQIPLSGNARLGFFDTPTYESRIYAYEGDVMYYSVIPASYGRGMVGYINIRIPLANKCSIYIKCWRQVQSGIATGYIRGQFIWIL